MALNGRNAGGGHGGAERDPRLDALYRAAAREAPPAHLDAAILAAARREVGARPRPFAATLRRWQVPVSIAAVVMVSASLVILVREEEGRRIEGPPVPAVAKPDDQPAEPRVLFSKPDVATDAEQPQVAAQAPEQHRRLRDDASRSAAMDKRPDPAPRETDRAAVSGATDVATPETAARELPQPFRAAPPRAAEERAAPAAPDTATAGSPAAPVELRSARSTADASPAEPMTGVMAVKPAAQDQRPVWHGFEKELPEKWLARIEELKRQGRAAEAEAMMSEFKRRFPEHPLAAGSK